MDVNRAYNQIPRPDAAPAPRENSGTAGSSGATGSSGTPGVVTAPVVAPYAPAPPARSTNDILTLGGVDVPVITADTPALAESARPEEETARQQPYELESLEQVVNQLNYNLSPFRRQMNISVHEPSQRIMVEIRDTVEDIVIREIPPEEMLDAFVAALEMHGMLLDQRG